MANKEWRGIPMTEANDDWIRAARLLKRAKEGDKDARREFERMCSSLMQTADGELAYFIQFVNEKEDQ